MVLGFIDKKQKRAAVRDAVSRGWHFENERQEHAVLKVTSRKFGQQVRSMDEARASEFRL